MNIKKLERFLMIRSVYFNNRIYLKGCLVLENIRTRNGRLTVFSNSNIVNI